MVVAQLEIRLVARYVAVCYHKKIGKRLVVYATGLFSRFK